MSDQRIKRLTVKAIENLKPRKKPFEVADGEGLYLTVRRNGSKSFNLRYRFRGKPRNLTLGPSIIGLGKARELAREALVLLARDIDPAAEKTTRRVTAAQPSVDRIEDVVAEFIERHAKPNTRGWQETERILVKDIIGAWKGRNLSEIGRADVHRLLDAIRDRGAPVGATRTFAQLRKMCRWAVSRGIIERSPCEGIERPSTEKKRERVLEDDWELSLVWHAAATLGWPFGPMVQLLILTGQRRSEVGGMTWAEIDLEKAVWTIPAERSKNHRKHAVPLSPQALAVLKKQPRFEGGFVFSNGGTAPSGFSRAKNRLDSVIDTLDSEGIAPWTLHDLRRSVASRMARIGVSLHVIERCLNHVSGSFGGIVDIYQKHSFSAEMREALEKWARYLEQIASGEATRGPKTKNPGRVTRQA